MLPAFLLCSERRDGEGVRLGKDEGANERPFEEKQRTFSIWITILGRVNVVTIDLYVCYGTVPE